MILAGGFAGEILLVADLNGISGIELIYLTILNIDGGDPILGSSHDVGLVKAHFVGAGGDPLIPVHIAVAKSEMPFAYDTGMIALRAQHLRQGQFSRIDQQRGSA
jgi:hypothetical protein